MELNAIFMNRIAARAGGGGNASKSVVSEQSFGSFMDMAVNSNANNIKNQTNANTTVDRSYTNKKQPKDNMFSASSKSKGADKENAVGDKGNEMEKTESTAEKGTDNANNAVDNKVDMSSEDQDQQPKNLEETNEEIVNELAQALNVSAEVIRQILAQMNITASELTDSDNLRNFIQNLSAADESLLDITEGETLEIVQEILQPEKAIQAEPTAQEQTSTESAAAKSVVTESTETDPILTAPIADELTVDQPVKTGTSGQDNNTGEDTAAQTKAPTVQAEDGKILLQEESPQEAFQDMIITGLSEVQNVHGADVKAEAEANVNTQDVINQIMDKMKVEVKGEVSEIRLTLRPENLGEVSLKISTENGLVTASFIAENQRVKEVIESNFNMLKDVLSGQGIQISQLSVSVGQNNQQRMMGEFARGQQTASRITRVSNMPAEAVTAQGENYSNPYDILDNSVDFTA